MWFVNCNDIKLIKGWKSWQSQIHIILSIRCFLSLNCQFMMLPLATNTAARLSWTTSLEWILPKFISISATFPLILSRHLKMKFACGCWIDSGLRTNYFSIFKIKASFPIKQQRVTSLLWRAFWIVWQLLYWQVYACTAFFPLSGLDFMCL